MLVFFLLPRNLSNHMDRQARTRDTVLVNSREMTGKSQTLPWLRGGAWRAGGKDDKKLNTLSPLQLGIILLITQINQYKGTDLWCPALSSTNGKVWSVMECSSQFNQKKGKDLMLCSNPYCDFHRRCNSLQQSHEPKPADNYVK